MFGVEGTVEGGRGEEGGGGGSGAEGGGPTEKESPVRVVFPFWFIPPGTETTKKFGLVNLRVRHQIRKRQLMLKPMAPDLTLLFREEMIGY